MRSIVEPARSRALSSVAVVALLAAGVAGCSSDMARFNEGPLASRTPPPQETTGSIQTQPTGRVESQALPPPPRTQNGAPGMGSYQPQPQYAPPRPEYTGSVPPQPQAAPNSWSWDGGTAITVAQGDTLEGIARRHHVPVHAIMQANNMTPPAFIQPGQRLVIPRSNNQYSAAPAAPPSTRLAANPGYTHTGPAAGNNVHVVQPGETLYSLARRYHKQPMLIAQANHVGLDHKVKIGDRVVIPGAGPIAPVAAVKPAPQQQRVAEVKAKPPATVKPQGSPGIAPPSAHTITPTVDPTAEPVAPLAAQPQPEATGSAPSFRWPVRGRVSEGFGPRAGGGQNDGINVAVPQGTPIKAAEDGVVAYAGSELKGYGNLVLVRHSNGFVTAYAHASELNVKKGEQIKRGQVIGKAGATGNVTAPQLHFEVRKGATPVDPIPYLSGG